MQHQSNVAIDFFVDSIALTVGRATERLVCAPADCLLTTLHVRANEQVGCGKTLCEVVQKDENGRPETISIVAPDWGIVKPVAGTKIFLPEQEKKPDAVFLRKGTPLCLITRERTGNDAGTIKGLTPRPTNVIARRRRRFLKMFLKRPNM